MEGTGGMNVPGGQDQAQNQQPKVVERLNPAVQQQLNLESVKTRAIGLYKAISRILEDFENIRRTGSEPKWQDLMGQYSMVNLELFNIMEDIKKVSKAFVVHPKNVNAENATVLPVMLSSKLLPEMETEDNSKREQLLHGTENLPVLTQIEKLKERISMIDAACGSAEKVLADCRKAYGLGSRQAPAVTPTLDKVQAAKIQEQETILRAAVNSGQGLHIPPDQRQVSASLPMHLADVLTVDSAQGFPDASGMYKTTTPSMTSNVSNTQGSVPQATGGQHIGRSIPSPSGPIGTTSFDNITTSPLPYANSPRSSTNIMNIPSPQQHQQQQQQHQQQQQRQKMMQLPHQQQQILAQQQYRQSSTPGLGQSQLSQLHDMAQQKFQSVPGQHQMQYSQSLAHQQFQNRQLLHGMGQNQLGQGNSLRSHLSQFSGATNNSALFNNAQTTPNTQMITNMSATMPSQSLLPRMQQFGLSSGQSQRSHPSQILSDQMFSMGGTNQGNLMPVQQQQQQQQTLGGGFGNMGVGNPQNLQSSNVLGMQNASSQLPNYQQQQQQQQQQRQQNQQQ